VDQGDHEAVGGEQPAPVPLAQKHQDSAQAAAQRHLAGGNNATTDRDGGFTSCKDEAMTGTGLPQPALRFVLFGGVRVWRDEVELALGPPKQRATLGMLLAVGGQPVTVSQLISMLWDDEPSASAVNQIHRYIGRLRRILEPGIERRVVGRWLLPVGAGYRLAVDEASCDLLQFRSLVMAAGSAQRAGSADEATSLLVQAMDIAAAPPADEAFRDLPVVRAIEDDRVRAAVTAAEQALRCGMAAEVLPSLRSIAAGHALDETVHASLMRCLHGVGRPSEALSVYDHIRERLCQELGADPGPALVDSQRAVLAAQPPPEPVFAGRGDVMRCDVGQPAAPARVFPAQLPHSVPDLVGRDDQVRRLTQLCTSTTSDALHRSAVILAVDGAAGVGKTALAVHTALRVTDAFPDGQLFLDLRGFDPRFRPLTAEEALTQLLRGLNADAEMIRTDVVAQAALYRSLLAGRRVLIVLDNAINAEQVRPLLPGSKGCLAIVTSRNRLAGLVARDGATRVSLDALRSADSLELLRATLGAAPVDADLAAARELAAQCGHLPLALRIAAERMAGGNNYELSDIVDELRVEGDRLDRLSSQDDESSVVRSVFSWSYHALKPEDARAFRLLSLHPSIEIGGPAASALLGTGGPAGRRQLDTLVQWNLLEQTARDRYRFHDLLRIYAAERAATDESPAMTSTAIERLLGWYLGSAIAAREVLAAGFGAIGVVTLEPEYPPLAFRTYDEAIAWARRELPVLVDVLQLATEHDFDDLAARLAVALGVLFHCTSRWPEWLQAIETGLAAARRIGDRLSQARLRNDAGIAYHFLGRHEEAVASHEAAVSILTELGDKRDQAIAINLAMAYSMMGRHLDTIPLLEGAMGIAREQGNRFVEASIAGNLGAVLSKLGRHADAIEHGQRSVAIARDAGTDHLLGHCLGLVGDTWLRAGRTEEAIRYFGDALALWRRLTDRCGEARSLHALAKARHQAGLTDGVRDLLTAALRIMPQAGNVAANEVRTLPAELDLR
jgi:DNA-binding SARP family transcriptional activator